MKLQKTLAAAPAVLLLLAGCATTEPAAPSSAPASSAVPSSPAASPSAAATPAPSATSEPEEVDEGVIGTIVRFTGDSNSVDVTIDQDSPAVRDFLSMLPLTLDLEEYGGREKIAYLPRSLDAGDTPGSEPHNGDFSYYAPWGNVIFYYDAPGGYSDQVLHLGVYSATLDQLNVLEGPGVRIEVVE